MWEMRLHDFAKNRKSVQGKKAKWTVCMQREKKRKRNGLGQNSAQTMPKALTSTCRLSLSLSQLSLSLYLSVSISLFWPEVQFVIGCDHESGQVSIPKRLKRKIQRKTGFPDTFVSMHLPATLMQFLANGNPFSLWLFAARVHLGLSAFFHLYLHFGICFVVASIS